MKILILSFYYQPDLCAGSFRCTALVNKMLEEIPTGSEIEVYTTLPNRYKSFSREAPARESNDNITINRVSLPTHKSGMLDQAKAFSLYYREVLKQTKNGNYDLVFATSSRLFTAFLGARVANKCGVPLYLDIRDIFIDTLKDVLSKPLSIFLIPILNLIEKYTFKNASRVNLVSKGFHEYFTERYPDLSYEFHSNGIDEEFIGINVDRNENGCASSKAKTILYAGNIGEGQGLHHIVPQLAKALGSEYKFVIVGDGGRKDNLVEMIKQYEVDNVELHLPVQRGELIELYRDADILFLHLNAYPAFKKVLPSKIFEYAAMGKPILAGVSGFSAEFLKREVSNCGVFPPGDSEIGHECVKNLQLVTKDRDKFVSNFSRGTIMYRMSCDILSVVK